MRGKLSVPDRTAAIRLALSACDLARQGIGMPPTPVLLEFTCGACDALDDFTSYLTPDKLEDLYAMIDGNFVGLGIELKIDPQGLRLVGVIRGGPAWEAGLKAATRSPGSPASPSRGSAWTRPPTASRERRGRASTWRSSARSGEHRQRPAGPPPRRGRERHPGQDRRPGRGHRLRPARRLPEDLDRGARPGDHGPSGAGDADPGARPPGQPGRPAQRGRGDRRPVHRRRRDRLDPRAEPRGRARSSGPAAGPGGGCPCTSWSTTTAPAPARSSPGPLQDHRRAIVIGERTYGKGSVQSIFSLRSAPAGLKLTTAKFYSPQNRPYSEQGVEPDVPDQDPRRRQARRRRR